MNYKTHYNTLIERAKTRLLEGYSEQHHVVPRCLGGSDVNSNLVRLTAEEHYVAHQLLVKIYPDNAKLVFAARMMTTGSKHHSRVNNKLYGWLKKKFSKAQSKAMTGRVLSKETREKIAEGNRGKVVSKETRQKLSVAHKGRQAWNKGRGDLMPSGSDHHMYSKKHTKEARAKISAAQLGTTHSAETKAKMSASAMGVPKSDAARKAMSIAKKGKPSWKKGMTGFKSTPGSFKKGNVPWNIGTPAYERAVEIDGITYRSRRIAAKHLSKDITTIMRWLKNGKAIDRSTV